RQARAQADRDPAIADAVAEDHHQTEESDEGEPSVARALARQADLGALPPHGQTLAVALPHGPRRAGRCGHRATIPRRHRATYARTCVGNVNTLAKVRFNSLHSRPSFRGASEAREPGIQKGRKI